MGRGLTVSTFVNLCHGLVTVALWWGEWGCVVGDSWGIGGGLVIGVLEIVGGRTGRLTPHLTSPLEGGRDELGRRRGQGVGGCGCGGQAG